jgi:hypothetical protein
VHAVWWEEIFNNVPAYYIRGQINPGGASITWETSTRVSLSALTGRGSFLKSQDNNEVQVEVDGFGRVHVAFAAENGELMYLRNDQSGAPGGWTTVEVATNYGKKSENNGFTMAIDDAGEPYVAWGNGLGGSSSRVAMHYRQGPNTWSGRVFLSNSYYLVQNVSMVVSGSGGGATVHVAFQSQAREDGGNEQRANYSQAQRDGIGGYSQIQFSGYGTEPKIAYDQGIQHLYLNYVGRSGSFVQRFSHRSLGNANWAPFVQSNINNNVWPGSSPMEALNGAVHMATEQKFNNGSNVQIHYRSYVLSTDTFSPWVLVSSGADGKSERPGIGANLGSIVPIWAVGTFDIKGNIAVNDLGGPISTPTPTITPSPTIPPRPSAAMALVGSESSNLTRFTNINAIFTNIQGGTPPYAYQLSNDNVTYQPVPPAPVAEGVPVGWELIPAASDACAARTVYGKVIDALGQQSDVLVQGMTIDPGVDVNVSITNPFLRENEHEIQDYPPGTGGASDGDPDYTRVMFYYGEVFRLPGECTGLASVQFGELEPPNLTSDEGSGRMPLSPPAGSTAQDAPDGTYNVSIQVTDGAGNPATFTEPIVLDRTPPEFTGGTVQIVDGQQNPISDTNSINVTLSFADVSATDITYGDRQAQQGNPPIWGIWAANSLQDIDPADWNSLNNLDWRPVELDADQVSESGGAYSFDISRWSLVAGEDFSPGSTYYVYATPLDGAGNYDATQPVMKVEVTLDASAQLPTTHAPLIAK